MKQKTLPSLRVSEKTFNDMDRAIKKYNEDGQHLVKINKNTFRRIAYEILAQSILKDISLPV